MAVQHKNLTGDQLHEPKGIETATAGTVYVANGSGSGTWQAGGGGGSVGDTDDVPEGTENLYFTNPRARSSLSILPGTSGITYSPSTGQFDFTGLEEAGITPNLHQRWISEFYTDGTTTDQQALENFIASVSEDTVLNWEAGAGRGPSGRYVYSANTIITNKNFRVIFKGNHSTVRFTGVSGSGFHFKPEYVAGSSSVTPTDYFGVEDFIFQAGATIDSFIFADFPYIHSRSCANFHARNNRFIPQDANNAAHRARVGIRCKNVWFADIHNNDCVITGFDLVSGSPVSGTRFITLEQLSVDNTVSRCVGTNMEAGVEMIACSMLAANITFNTGSYSRGKKIVQGANSAILVNNATQKVGYTYSLTDLVGTITAGPADLQFSDGSSAGSVTIGTTLAFHQPPEAPHVCNGTSFVHVNYGFLAAMPSTVGPLKMVMPTFTDTHMAYRVSAIKMEYCAFVYVGTGVEIQPELASTVGLDFNFCDAVNVVGAGGPTNGTINCTYLKARNVNVLNMTSNILIGWLVPGDFDNTVKDANISNNSGFSTGTFINTGNRYQGAATRGIRFINNGSLGNGLGLDQHDVANRSWVPTVTSSSGTITSYTIGGASFRQTNGGIQFNIKIVINDRGSATGQLRISLPTNVATGGVTNIYASAGDQVMHGSINNSLAVNVVLDGANQRLQVFGDGSPDAFQVLTVYGNYTYYISGTINAPIA